MLDELSKILPPCGVALTLGGATYALGKYLNETLDEDLRLRVSLWFFGSNPSINWHVGALKTFQAIFGDRTFSWKCLRSTLVITIVFGCLLFYSERIYNPPEDPTSKLLWPDGPDHFGSWRALAESLLSYNMLIDYSAVTKSRFLLWVSVRWGSSRWLILGVLLVDALTTLGFLVLGFKSFGILADALPKAGFKLSVSAFLASVCLPIVHSVWMLIFALATVAAGAASWLSRKIPDLSRFLSKKRIETEPISLIGEFAAALVVATILVARFA